MGDNDDDATDGPTNVGGAQDHGTSVVGDALAVFFRSLANIDGGFVEEFRVGTERAYELLRSHGLDVSRPYRIKLRHARRLINKLYEVAEADLPPETDR